MTNRSLSAPLPRNGNRRMKYLYGLTVLAGAVFAFKAGLTIDHIQGEMASEVTPTTAILQTRLTAPEISSDLDVPGARGVVRFEIDRDLSFPDPVRTRWQESLPERDYIVREKIGGLEPDTSYFYRIEFGRDHEDTEFGPARKFRTLPGPGRSRKFRLAVVT